MGRRTTRVAWRAVGTATAGLYLASVVALFGYFYPVLSARTITYDQWNQRMWLQTCHAKPNTHHENAPCWI
jgi:dolichyl-phosphate-mannose--protein O-mannosyl transferase